MDARDDNGVNELLRRIARVPDVLETVLATPCDVVREWSLGPLVLTGVGASGAVARSAAAMLRNLCGLDVTELPLSCFAGPIQGRGRGLVVLSQELSPNAHLALSRAGDFDSAWVLTSRAANDARLAGFAGQVCPVQTPDEPGLLVRVMGPLATVLTVLRLAGCTQACATRLPELPGAMRAALLLGIASGSQWPQQCNRAPLLATGWYSRSLELLSWTWMEALFVEPPPVWDVLEVAHGPWQQLYAARSPLLTLERVDDVPGLWPRLAEMSAERGHQLVTFSSTLPAPLCFFEHAMAVLGLLSALVERSPRDLRRWPGFGTDGPLYGLR